jgi:hypothetical protein
MKHVKRTKKKLAAWGSLGGSAKSRAKKLAARANGKKGGRPKGSKNKK